MGAGVLAIVLERIANMEKRVEEEDKRDEHIAISGSKSGVRLILFFRTASSGMRTEERAAVIHHTQSGREREREKQANTHTHTHTPRERVSAA